VRIAAIPTLLVACCIVVGCGSSSSKGGPVTLNFWAYNEPGGTFKAAADSCSKQHKDEYTIKFQALGNDPNTQRQQLVRRLAAKDSSIDLMSMDVIWTAEFAGAGWIKPFPPAVAARIRKGTLPGPLATATYKGRLYGAPANSNTQLLWYRKDLVKHPAKTWSGLIAQASRLKKAGKIEIQGAAYEGLVVWFNSLVQSAGGKILTPSGKVVLGPSAEKAAAIIKALATSKAADPSLSNQKEDQNRQAFEKGTAAFEVNYPFIYPSAAMVKSPKNFQKRIGWATYPRVEANTPARPPIGGFNWGVGGYTKHPTQAFHAAECLRSEANQRTFALKGGLPPTLSRLYDDKKFAKQYPFGGLIRTALKTAAVRPVSPAYSDVSLAIATALSPPTSIDPRTVVNKLKGLLKDAADSKALL